MSIGQTQAQAVLGAAGEAIEAAVETALAYTLDDFGSFTPGLDWTDTKLFSGACLFLEEFGLCRLANNHLNGV